MKKLLLLAALFTTLLSPFVASAKDKDKKKDKNYRDEEYYKNEAKRARDDIRNAQSNYDRVRDRLKNGQPTRSMWDQLRALGADLDRLNYQFERGNADPRYVSGQARRINDSLIRLGEQAQSGYGYRRRY